MNNTKPGIADYMLAVMDQILGTAAVEKEVSEKERVRIQDGFLPMILDQFINNFFYSLFTKITTKYKA